MRQKFGALDRRILERHQSRDALLQEQLDAAYCRVAVHTLDHRYAREVIGQGKQDQRQYQETAAHEESVTEKRQLGK